MISQAMIEELMKDIKAKERFIIRLKRSDSWYYHNLQLENIVTGVIWTPFLPLAYHFPDEKSVEEFKMNFISPRNVEILRIERG